MSLKIKGPLVRVCCQRTLSRQRVLHFRRLERPFCDQPRRTLAGLSRRQDPAPRDRFVGWDPATRQRNLPLVVNHARILILPWIRLPCLPSHLLACVQRQLPLDWQQRYRIRPVLLETFCETPRFEGTCYRAANWIHLGQTQGRGKLDVRHQFPEPVKNIFVKPLCPDWKAILNR